MPKRKKSKHRIYDNEDLKEILSIASLNRAGLKISKIASLSAEERNRLTAAQEKQDTIFDEYIHQFMAAAIVFDDILFQKIYQTIMPQVGLEHIMIHIFYPLLQQIGFGWMCNQIKPAHEHFISEQITRRLDVEMQQLPIAQKGPLTLLFLPEGEHHTLPLHFIKYLLRKNHKRTAFLGANTDLSIVQKYLEKNKVDKIHLHLITEFFDHQPVKYVKKLLSFCKDQQIILSGPVGASIQIEHPRITRLNSMQAILNYATT